jgi:hypothetical protein
MIRSKTSGPMPICASVVGSPRSAIHCRSKDEASWPRYPASGRRSILASRHLVPPARSSPAPPPTPQAPSAPNLTHVGAGRDCERHSRSNVRLSLVHHSPLFCNCRVHCKPTRPMTLYLCLIVSLTRPTRARVPPQECLTVHAPRRLTEPSIE